MLQSDTVKQLSSLRTQKIRRYFMSGNFSEVPSIKLVIFLVNRGSGWSLFSGGCFLELVVNTGLTVHSTEIKGLIL